MLLHRAKFVRPPTQNSSFYARMQHLPCNLLIFRAVRAEDADDDDGDDDDDHDDDDNGDVDDDDGLYPTFQHISAGSWRKVREIHQILLSNPRYLASVKNRRRKA